MRSKQSFQPGGIIEAMKQSRGAEDFSQWGSRCLPSTKPLALVLSYGNKAKQGNTARHRDRLGVRKDPRKHRTWGRKTGPELEQCQGKAGGFQTE